MHYFGIVKKYSPFSFISDSKRQPLGFFFGVNFSNLSRGWLRTILIFRGSRTNRHDWSAHIAICKSCHCSLIRRVSSNAAIKAQQLILKKIKKKNLFNVISL